MLLSPQYTQRQYQWTQWKAVYALKGSPFQYDDDGTIYTIWTYDGPDAHVCQIWKDAVPDSIASSFYPQAQNDLDKADFEANFKASGNAPLTQLDTDGAQIVRIKAAKRGWSFWAVPVEITTSTLQGTIYAKMSNGIDIPWINCKIYNGADVEITDILDIGTCEKTVIDFEPTFDFEIIGGSLRIHENPAADVRLWIVGAPDIPALYGGSKEFASGVNLKFMAPDASFDIDGRVTKFLTYNSVTHQGKMRIILKHPMGLQVNLQTLIHIYRL